MSNTDLIIDKLQNKACLKQDIYKVTHKVFDDLKTLTKKMAEEINAKLPKDIDDKVRLIFTDINEFEFRLKFSGDTLAFILHSNVVTLQPNHPVMDNDFVKEDESRSFFGSIRVYDFLSDSLKYNRFQDAGILMARMLINKDNHYYIDSGLHFKALKQNIEKNEVAEKNLRFFIENAMITAMEVDLIAPEYKDIFTVSLQQHFDNNQGDAGTKLGFQMSLDK